MLDSLGAAGIGVGRAPAASLRGVLYLLFWSKYGHAA